jgi:hypothetical protein
MKKKAGVGCLVLGMTVLWAAGTAGAQGPSSSLERPSKPQAAPYVQRTYDDLVRALAGGGAIVCPRLPYTHFNPSIDSAPVVDPLVSDQLGPTVSGSYGGRELSFVVGRPCPDGIGYAGVTVDGTAEANAYSSRKLRDASVTFWRDRARPWLVGFKYGQWMVVLQHDAMPAAITAFVQAMHSQKAAGLAFNNQ